MINAYHMIKAYLYDKRVFVSGGDTREWDPVGHACLVGGEPAGEVAPNSKP